MYRRYYSYNDMPTIAPPKKTEKPKETKPPEKKEASLFENGKLFGRFETDDIILLVVVVILLADNCDDKLLLLALAFIFFNS